MFHQYQYEAEFYPTLSRLPLDVRRKLDITGIKLALKDWLAFSLTERRVLCHLPCDAEDEQQIFGEYLNCLSLQHRGKAIERIEMLSSNLWDETVVPQPVAQKSAELQASVTLPQWRQWPAHHRYALYKTAVSKAQPEAFELVLRQLRASQKLV